MTLIRAARNDGYAAGINLGRAHRPARADAVAILNPDLIVSPGVLDALAEALRDPTVGVAVPRILEADGSMFFSLRREPTVLSALGDAVFGRHWPGRPSGLSDTLWRHSNYATGRDVEWASGASWLVARDCDEATGRWDERFFLYSEETDYARRVRRTGLRIQYVPGAVVTHIGGGSGRSIELDSLMAVNRVADHRANNSKAKALAFGAVTVMHHAVRGWDAGHREIVRTLLSERRRLKLPGREHPREA